MSKRVFTCFSEVYFDELDALWVLHHGRYLHHLERAQQAFFQELLGVGDFNAERDEDIYVVVRNLNIEYREPVRNPGTIKIHYTVSRLREAGVEMAFQITSPAEETVYARGSRTVCKLSGKTHQPTGWSAPFREALQAWADS